jgi:hypothetical protein
MPDRDTVRKQVTVRKPDPPPGQEAQLDYGYLGQWTDPASGKARRVWAFVMVLSCSRHLFVRPVVTMPLRVWVEAHVAVLLFFGGAPRRLVTDNPEGQRHHPGPVRPQAQPHLRRAGQPLRHAGGPRQGAEAQRQAARGAADPLRARQLLRRSPGCQPAGDGAGRRGLVRAGRRPPRLPAAGRRAAAAAAHPVRAGRLVQAQGPRRLPHPDRRRAVLGAMAAGRPPRRRSGHHQAGGGVL